MVNVVDPCELVKQLINGDANYATNVNGAKPLIVNANKQKRFQVANKPGLIYMYTSGDEPNYDSYAAEKRYDRIHRVSIEFNFRHRDYMLSNVRRVRDIIEFYYATIGDFTMTGDYTNPYQLMKEVTAKDLSRSNKKAHHKYIIDVDLIVLGKVKATSL